MTMNMEMMKAMVAEMIAEEQEKRRAKGRDYDRARYRRNKTTSEPSCLDFFDDEWTYNNECNEEKVETIYWKDADRHRFCGTLENGTVVVGKDRNGSSRLRANYDNYRHMKDIVRRTLLLKENQNCYFKGGEFYVARFNKERHTWKHVSAKDFCDRFRTLVWYVWCDYLDKNYKNVEVLTRNNNVQRCYWTNNNIKTLFTKELSKITEPRRKLKGYYIKDI